jgi:hypothetical protein
MAANPVTGMAIASIVGWAVVSALVGIDNQRAVLIGMFAPLGVAVGSWIVIERAHSRTPERVTGVMIKLFAAKMIVFGGYVASVILLLPVERIAVVVSFVAQDILLHFLEALYLRRLFSGGGHADGRVHGR